MIEVIAGPMFAGKSSLLVSALVEARGSNKQVLAIKHALDDRDSPSEIVTHDGARVACRAVHSLSGVSVDGADVLGIDEFQFFDYADALIVSYWSARGTRVIIAGLDMDFLGVPFESMAAVMAMAWTVTKVRANCTVCGCSAMYSQRISGGRERVQVGGPSAYEPRCAVHFQVNDVR